jgi:hypothetical protein
MNGPWKAECLHFSITTPSSIKVSFDTSNLFQKQVKIILSLYFLTFLGVFAELREATVSFIMCVCPTVPPSLRPSVRRLSVRMEQLGSAVGCVTAVYTEVHGFDYRCCHCNFSFTLSFRPHYGPGVESASNRNEQRKISWGLKAPVRRLTNLPPSCAESLEILELQPPGTLRACNGMYLFYRFKKKTYYLLLFVSKSPNFSVPSRNSDQNPVRIPHLSTCVRCTIRLIFLGKMCRKLLDKF